MSIVFWAGSRVAPPPTLRWAPAPPSALEVAGCALSGLGLLSFAVAGLGLLAVWNQVLPLLVDPSHADWPGFEAAWNLFLALLISGSYGLLTGQLLLGLSALRRAGLPDLRRRLRRRGSLGLEAVTLDASELELECPRCGAAVPLSCPVACPACDP